MIIVRNTEARAAAASHITIRALLGAGFFITIKIKSESKTLRKVVIIDRQRPVTKKKRTIVYSPNTIYDEKEKKGH